MQILSMDGTDYEAILEIERLAVEQYLASLPIPQNRVNEVVNSPEMSMRQVNARTVEDRQKVTESEPLNIDFGNGVTLELVKVPAGKFMMGSDKSAREKPIYEVQLKEFLIGKYAITNAQWRSVMKKQRSANCDKKFQGDLQPVVGVSWHEAREFCMKLSQQTEREVRLPTEAEWEYACRAGTTTPFVFGKTITTDQVNYSGKDTWDGEIKGKYREVTVDVNSFQPNAWGIYQMHGNVWEWCLDEWHDSYADKPENLKTQGNQAWGYLNVDNNDNRSYLLRGGFWDCTAIDCCSADRYGDNAGDWGNVIGFRVVVSVLS